MGVRRIQTCDLPLKMSMSYHHIMVVFVIFSGMFSYTCLVQSFEIQNQKKYGLGCTLAPGLSRFAGAGCKLEPICQGNWCEKGKKRWWPRKLNPRARTEAKRTVPPHHFIVCDLLRHTLFLTCQWENREIKSEKIYSLVETQTQDLDKEPRKSNHQATTSVCAKLGEFSSKY